MNIREFIENKIIEMVKEGYREVIFLSAMDCTLSENGKEEFMLVYESDLNQNCICANSFQKENKNNKGSEIRIYGIPKRKRKGTVVSFYVEVIDDKERKIEKDKRMQSQ